MSFKSFFNWVQGSAGAQMPGENSASQWNEKRRQNRMDLPLEGRLVVHLMSQDGLSDEARTLVASVGNISMRGCGLIFENSADWERLKVGQILVASLAVDDFSIPVHVEVVRLLKAPQAAVRFKPPFPRELEKLERYLEPRFLGRSLREIDPSKLQQQTRKGFRWFQGVNETHFFTWTGPDGETVSHQQLVFLDRVVEWKEPGVVRTGRLREAADIGKSWERSELIDFDETADVGILRQAKILVESSSVEARVREVFLKRF